MNKYLAGYVGHRVEGNCNRIPRLCEVFFDLNGCVIETEDGQTNAIPMTTYKDGEKVTVQLTHGDVIGLKEILDRCEEILEGMG